MFAHAPAVGAATLPLVSALLTETALDPTLRELVILRAAQRCDCRYAWVQHVTIACGVGVEEADSSLDGGQWNLARGVRRHVVVFSKFPINEDRARSS
jgi:AhpD family alkylhydroperoxidase